jgi:hypothetical protein
VKFYVTFGQRYRIEQHPHPINGVYPHPDGWVTIEAPSAEAARAAAVKAFGIGWAFIYHAEDWDHDSPWYSRGELGVITAS